jgi:hypothetical protein
MRRRSKKGLANGSTLDKLTLIQVDFEEHLLAGDLHQAKVMLAVGIIVFVEIVVLGESRNNLFIHR